MSFEECEKLETAGLPASRLSQSEKSLQVKIPQTMEYIARFAENVSMEFGIYTIEQHV